MRLRDLGEGGLIERIRSRFRTSAIPVGIGDDAAILDVPPGRSLVYCCDLVVENRHFIRGIHPPDAIGYKTVAVNVSDVGAMGGNPMYFVISFAAPGDLPLAWVDGFYSGIEKACRDFGVALVGGDTSSAESIFVDVAIIGSVPAGKAILRSGAKPGDSIYVTGTLGESSLGLDLLRAGKTDSPAVRRHLYPEPRHRVGAAVLGIAHAMIDISDGLSTDLDHIVKESRVSARIDKSKLPAAEGATDEHVLHGGEEYELLITAPELPARIEGVALTRIGEIVASVNEQQIFLEDGSVLQPKGWDHYLKKLGTEAN